MRQERRPVPTIDVEGGLGQTGMLRSIIIGADQQLGEQLEALFLETGRFALLRSFLGYPEGTSLERLLRAHAPQVVFLSVDDLPHALRVRDEAERTAPGVPMVAFGRNSSQEVLLELMKVGVREFVPQPFEAGPAIGLADRIEEQLARNPLSFDATDLLFSFLPAKPGVGTSTLALNITKAMSRGTKALLADFDLNSGLIAFMLKMSSPYSLVDAAEKSTELDENLWPQLVTEFGDFHVLPSGRTQPGLRITPEQIRALLTFARRQYGVISADLSGNMEKYSVELMQESKQIFLVTTPEIPPLHLARERLCYLRQLDVGDRTSVLLNRHHKRSSITVSQIEDLLEAPVYETFPNSYSVVHDSLVSGKPVDARADLGRKFAALADRILGPDAAGAKKTRKKGFFDQLSVLPGKKTLRV